MEKNTSDSLETSFRSYRVIFIPMMTLALYLSGLFVILTPLPLIYGFFRQRSRFFVETLLPTFIVLVILYVVVLPPLHSFYETHSHWAWLFPMPGMDLLGLVSHQAVTFFGLGYFLFFVGSAYGLFRILTGQFSPFFSIGMATISFLVLAFILFGVYALSVGTSPVGFIESFFYQAISEFILLREKSGISMEQLAFFKENAENLVYYSVTFFPSVLFCSILIILLLNLVVGKRILPSFVKEVVPVPMNEWSCSFYGVWIVIGCLFLLLTNSYLFKLPVFFFIGANLLVVFSFVYFLQGLSIVSYFFEKKQVTPLARILVYGLIFILFQTVGILLIGFGFFDSWFSFRKRINIQQDK